MMIPISDDTLKVIPYEWYRMSDTLWMTPYRWNLSVVSYSCHLQKPIRCLSSRRSYIVMGKYGMTHIHVNAHTANDAGGGVECFHVGHPASSSSRGSAQVNAAGSRWHPHEQKLHAPPSGLWCHRWGPALHVITLQMLVGRWILGKVISQNL